MACMAVLSSCGKKEEAPASATESKAETPAPAVSDAAMEAEISKALAAEPAPSGFPGAGSTTAGDELDQWVDDIRRDHPTKNATELLNVPEVNEKLRAALEDLGKDEKLKKQIDSSVEVAAAFIGLDGEPGTHRLNLDLNGYSSERTDRMLKAVLAGNGKSLVDFVVGEIGEAAPDLSYGGAQRAPNGVAIDTVPPPPAQNAGSPEND